MTGTRSSRGDVNAIRNGLIRDGLITSFETNFDTPVGKAFALHVRVAADQLGTGAGFEERRRELQGRIMRQLEPLAPGLIVSVRGPPRPTAAAQPLIVAHGGITGDQCRAARRLLGWSQEKHSHEAGLRSQGVGAFERGEVVPRPETMAAIVGALEEAGLEFTEDGVRLRPEALKRKRS